MKSTISISWSAEDVLETADEMDVELTDEEALTILHELKKNHDASIGINWAVIKNAIRNHENEEVLTIPHELKKNHDASIDWRAVTKTGIESDKKGEK